APLPYRGRSPLPPPRYPPDPMFGPPSIRPPPSPRGPVYRRRSMSPIRGPGSGGSGGRAPLIYSSRPPRSPSPPIPRNIPARRGGPRTPTSPSH
ncbi:14580_t:CDS:2, partial [Entrophospora sp. SA101]